MGGGHVSEGQTCTSIWTRKRERERKANERKGTAAVDWMNKRSNGLNCSKREKKSVLLFYEFIQLFVTLQT